ncbi:MocR-like pyridoxine biosynthesis transcription factor PdxR [Cupriavidus sp. PET2-C1]
MDKPLIEVEASHLEQDQLQPVGGRKPRASKARLLDLITIDRSNDSTLVDQIVHAVRRMITNGALQPGDLLPSTREMSRTLHIARTTALAVITRLDEQGFVETRVGSGVRVRARQSDHLPDLNLPLSASSTSARPRRAREGHSTRSDLRDKLPKHVLISSTQQRNMQLLSSAIPFAPGMPAIDQFPYREWSEFAAKAWRNATSALLETRDPAGYRPLREALAAYLGSARGVRCSADQIIIVSGAQHAFDLTLRVLTKPGDTALIEDPGFLGARNAMLSAGLSLRGIPLDEQGVLVPTEGDSDGARLLYTTPSHQYPMGITMSVARREALLEWAYREGCFIFEDDYSSEFRYGSAPLPALQGADEGCQVIYAGTFNKIMFPSLRVGYLVIPDQLVDIFLSMRTWSDGSPPGAIQAAMLEFIDRGTLYSHIRRMREIYAGRQALLREMLRVRFGASLSVVSDAAGLNLATVASSPIDDLAFFRSALDENVVCPPLSQYFLEVEPLRGFQLGFAASNEAQMKIAMDRLEAVWTRSGIKQALL